MTQALVELSWIKKERLADVLQVFLAKREKSGIPSLGFNDPSPY